MFFVNNNFYYFCTSAVLYKIPSMSKLHKKRAPELLVKPKEVSRTIGRTLIKKLIILRVLPHLHQVTPTVHNPLPSLPFISSLYCYSLPSLFMYPPPFFLSITLYTIIHTTTCYTDCSCTAHLPSSVAMNCSHQHKLFFMHNMHSRPSTAHPTTFYC